MILSHTSLPVLGHVLFHLQSSYVSLGAPITPFMAAVLCKLGLVRHMSKTWVMKFFGLVNWDNVVLKMAGKRALEVLAAHQDQVDLWMMGEGPHHMHHAKSDVSYALLPKVCEEVEQQHPHIKLATRGTGDLVQLEYSEGMPAKLDQGSAPSSQLPWQRTMAIRHSKELLASDPEAAVVEIAEAVLESALHCCATADRSLLRQVLKDMKLETLKQEKLGCS
ncbi:unnamed protein product [Polarella glacialis]|uniref:Uncharacterized protein n=1 Tax=Polarella glacialis TaxID=89957 RepID=A0A813EM20_POLGL|nr:unnamed protein product [Polarella glacialis]